MRDIQHLLGDPFFDLLEGAADCAVVSIGFLVEGLGQGVPDSEKLSAVSRKSQELRAAIEHRLAHTIMASLKKEDIHAVADALGRIPDGIERLAGRCQLVRTESALAQLTNLAEALSGMVEVLASMVRLLRRFESLEPMKELRARLEKGEERIEHLTQEANRCLLHTETDPVKIVSAKDALEHVNAVATLCSGCGDLLQEITLKYS